jgi:hypothetical protein
MPRQTIRSYDKESGMNRTSTSNKKERKPNRQPEPQPESDTDGSATESEVEEFLDKKQKDDTRRTKPAPKSKNIRDKNRRPTNAPEEADIEDVDEVKEKEPTSGTFAPFMIAMSYQTGFTKVGFPEPSTYIPDISSMFTTLFYMSQSLSENTLLHQIFPAYHSIALYAYYAHVVFYQILRVRNDASMLTRSERRALRAYESIGALESWPIATPMIGFILALGRITPEGGKYGQIVPCFPEYSNLSATPGTAIARLPNVHGIGRLPIIPAMQQFLHNFGNGTAAYEEAELIPVPTSTLGAGPPINHFVGLTRSRTTDQDFQILTHSSGWKLPHETGVDTYMMITEQKRALIRRWKVPDFPSTTDITDIDVFLGLQRSDKLSWMKNLLRLSAEVNNFFPGSVNMASIPTLTRVETVTEITYALKSGATAIAVEDDTWYVGRRDRVLSMEGKVLRDDSQVAYQMAQSQGVRATYHASILPPAGTVNIATAFDQQADGDYFDDATAPRTEMRSYSQPDPIMNAAQLIEAHLYNNKGGQN